MPNVSDTTLVGIACLLIYELLIWYRLRKIRGPRFAWASHFWMAKTALSGEMNHIYETVNRKYGTEDSAS